MDELRVEEGGGRREDIRRSARRNRRHRHVGTPDHNSGLGGQHNEEISCVHRSFGFRLLLIVKQKQGSKVNWITKGWEGLIKQGGCGPFERRHLLFDVV
jgi:hypothetical protein